MSPLHMRMPLGSATVASPASAPRGNVFIVDDDPSVCRSLLRLLRASHYEANAFVSAHEFLDFRYNTADATSGQPLAASSAQHYFPLAECLVLDICMPAMDGLTLQEELARRNDSIPIVFITAHGDVPACRQALKKGAVDFLTKPFDQQSLHSAIGASIDRNREMRQQLVARQDAMRRINTLSAREREVLSHVVTGALNKQIAADLGISEQTVKVHRRRVMNKTGVTSVAELVRLFDCVPGTGRPQALDR